MAKRARAHDFRHRRLTKLSYHIGEKALFHEGEIPKLRSERDDAYDNVVVYLTDRVRVIRCRDDVQWILQRRDAAKPHRGFWRGKSYVTERNSLIRVCVALQSEIGPDEMSLLCSLPERIMERPSPLS